MGNDLTSYIVTGINEINPVKVVSNTIDEDSLFIGPQIDTRIDSIHVAHDVQVMC